MDKERKKEYDTKCDRVMIRLSVKERILLNHMMEKEEWYNIAGFIKMKLFGENIDQRYDRIKRKGDLKSTKTILEELMHKLYSEISYLNWRFNREVERLAEAKKTLSEKDYRKLTLIMSQNKDAILKRTEEIVNDCEELLQYLNVNIQHTAADDIRNLPDEVIEKLGSDWNDTMSAFAQEKSRRMLEKIKKGEPIE